MEDKRSRNRSFFLNLFEEQTKEEDSDSSSSERRRKRKAKREREKASKEIKNIKKKSSEKKKSKRGDQEQKKSSSKKRKSSKSNRKKQAKKEEASDEKKQHVRKKNSKKSAKETVSMGATQASSEPERMLVREDDSSKEKKKKSKKSSSKRKSDRRHSDRKVTTTTTTTTVGTPGTGTPGRGTPTAFTPVAPSPSKDTIIPIQLGNSAFVQEKQQPNPTSANPHTPPPAQSPNTDIDWLRAPKNTQCMNDRTEDERFEPLPQDARPARPSIKTRQLKWKAAEQLAYNKTIPEVNRPASIYIFAPPEKKKGKRTPPVEETFPEIPGYKAPAVETDVEVSLANIDDNCPVSPTLVTPRESSTELNSKPEERQVEVVEPSESDVIRAMLDIVRLHSWFDDSLDKEEHAIVKLFFETDCANPTREVIKLLSRSFDSVIYSLLDSADPEVNENIVNFIRKRQMAKVRLMDLLLHNPELIPGCWGGAGGGLPSAGEKKKCRHEYTAEEEDEERSDLSSDRERCDRARALDAVSRLSLPSLMDPHLVASSPATLVTSPSTTATPSAHSPSPDRNPHSSNQTSPGSRTTTSPSRWTPPKSPHK